jgi:hypothetical protein
MIKCQLTLLKPMFEQMQGEIKHPVMAAIRVHKIPDLVERHSVKLLIGLFNIRVCGAQIVPLDPAPGFKQLNYILDHGCRVSVRDGKEEKTQVDHVITLLELGRDLVEEIPVVEAVDVAGAPGGWWEPGKVDVDSVEDGVGELVCCVEKPETCSRGNVGDARVVSDCVSDS